MKLLPDDIHTSFTTSAAETAHETETRPATKQNYFLIGWDLRNPIFWLADRLVTEQQLSELNERTDSNSVWHVCKI